MRRAAAALLACAVLAGCAGGREEVRRVETVRIDIPIAVHRVPPPELLEPIDASALPEFVAPGDPRATSALTPEGEKRLRILLHDVLTRLRAWSDWSSATTSTSLP